MVLCFEYFVVWQIMTWKCHNIKVKKGILGNSLKIIEDFLVNTYDRAVINNQTFWMGCSEHWSTPRSPKFVQLLALCCFQSTSKIYQPNYHQMTVLCFRLYATEIHQQINQITTLWRQEAGLINGNIVLTMILQSKVKK